MRHIREVLRLHHALALSGRQIGQSLGLHHSTVTDLVARAQRAQVPWPLPPTWDDARLEQALYPGNQGRPRRRPEPDWPSIHADLRRYRGMTLELAWVEYRQAHPDGLGYSQFCVPDQRWRRHLHVTLRQHYAPGEVAFFDDAGATIPIVDGDTGRGMPAQVFVAVLGYSQAVYAEVQLDPSVASWIAGPVHAFAAWGGVPARLVPDNLKAGVTQPHPYEPGLQARDQECAEYYGTVVVPARVRKPQDKAQVEQGVQRVERWILAVRRKRRFFRVADAQAAVADLVRVLNARPFQKKEGSRATLLAEEQPALKPLPPHPFEVGTWRWATVHPDDHVEVDRRYDRVPHRLVGERVEVRVSATAVEIFHQHVRVASHGRLARKGAASTTPGHRPPHHRRYPDGSPARFERWAARIGTQTLALIQAVLAHQKHPEQAYRSAFGILRLAKQRGEAALEAAAAPAVAADLWTYRAVAALAQQAVTPPPPAVTPPHDNVRGAPYYP